MSAIDRAATFQVYEVISNVPQIAGTVTTNSGETSAGFGECLDCTVTRYPLSVVGI
jgi:hypothetical protein